MCAGIIHIGIAIAHPAHSCWELGSAPVDDAPAGAGHCKAAVTVSAAVFWNPGSLLPCEPEEEETEKQHCSCRAASLQRHTSDTLSLDLRERISEFQKRLLLQHCRNAGSEGLQRVKRRKRKPAVRNV